MPIRQMTDRDVPSVVAAWNRALRFDEITEDRFRSVFLDDPNYEPESTYVSVDPDGAVLGFAAAVVRREPAGRDGGGRAQEFGQGYLKAFFTLPSDPAYSTATDLLAAVEAYCRAAGKRRITVTTYGGPYVFPGVDVRYEATRHHLDRHGYRDLYTIECVGVALDAADIARQTAQCQARLAPEVSVVTWEPSRLPALQTFAAEGNMPGWFPVGWEALYDTPQEHCLVLQKGDEILGWARFWPRGKRAGFGPILVLDRARGSGYGARLLLECMARARQAGCREMTAQWANTGFYTRHGWQIIRRFAVFTKELG